ncbi:uncharacterized protein [Antedon mediterranea]|uniref:uncharacterized protein n=1 Tax=Antedon mediterranea TaxID=105859 RepID=UPI003AF88DB2
MVAQPEKARSSFRRLSLKGLQKNSSYSVLDDASRLRSDTVSSADDDKSEKSPGVELVMTKDTQKVMEPEEQKIRKHKRKFSLLKGKKDADAEYLVVEDNNDINLEDGKPDKKKHKMKFNILKNKKKRTHDSSLVIENNKHMNTNMENKENKKKKNKYEKNCSLTKEEKRKKKKKKSKRIKKAGRRAAKALGNGFIHLGTAFRYMSPIAAMSDMSPNYYESNYNGQNTSYL